MKSPKNILWLAAAVLILIIGFQNLKAIPLQVLFWTVRVSPVILLPLLLLAGFAAGYFTRRKRG